MKRIHFDDLNSSEFNACQFNPEHELFACGSIEVKAHSSFIFVIVVFVFS